MEFRILGPLEVATEAGPVVLPRGRARGLLALLVVHAGEVVSSDRLIDALWQDPPPRTARTALHGLVSGLRRRLEPGRSAGRPPGVLQTVAPGYVLAVEAGQVDARRFRHLVSVAAGDPPARRAALLRQALALWRGPALAEFTYEPFAQSAIAELTELRLTALEARIGADLACGRHANVVGELGRLVAEHPLRERLRAHLMLALYRCGRQAEALEAYAAARRQLRDELAIEPGPGLRELEQAILRQDRSLDLAPEERRADEPARAGAEPLAQPWIGQSRKTVTVVFVDLAPSVATRRDAEVVVPVVARGSKLAAGILGRHGGTVEGVIGDVAVAVFGLPVAHEDDALRAIRAADELRRALADLNATGDVRLAARMGVSTGEVLVGAHGSEGITPSGRTVSVAARLQQRAADGEVLVGESTRRLVRDAIAVAPAPAAVGEADGEVPPWRLVAVIDDPRPRDPQLDTPLVGRRQELNWLREMLSRATRERRSRLVTVLGEAGVGKSRLAVELARGLQGGRVLLGRCPPYGEHATFAPLRELVAGAEDMPARSAVLAVLDSDDSDGGLGLFPAVRRFVEAVAESHALVIVLDDAHWAQAPLFDLLEYLAEAVMRGVLLLALGRPELLERRPGWQGGSMLHLDPLGDEHSTALVAERLAGRHLPPDTVARIVQTAQGNPLFIEQLVAAAHDDPERPPPPTVQALLAARLDRLGPAERDLLRCAAVIGSEFTQESLGALVPEPMRRALGRHLRRLADKELVRASDRRGSAAFGFRHVLVRSSAYHSMTHQTRAELHRRFAEWVGQHRTGTSTERDALVGYHLEQSYRHAQTAGLDHAGVESLAVRAGEHLARAGLAAYQLLDVDGAVNMLDRARALLPAVHPRRQEVVRCLVEGLPVLGRHADAEAAIAELLASAGADSASDEHLRLERSRVRLLMGPDPIPLETVRRDAVLALQRCASRGDDAGTAKAWFVLGLVHRRRGAVAELAEAARRGLAAARRAGHAREAAGAQWNLAWAVQAGATHASEAIALCRELSPLADTVHPGVLCEQAVLHAMLEEFDAAHELADRARQLMIERWRHRGPLMYPEAAGARIALLAGDLPAAEARLQSALERALQMGVRDHVAQLAALLAQTLLGLEHADRADRFVSMSAAFAPAESAATQAMVKTAAALASSARHRHREAAQLMLAALEPAPADMLNLRADLHRHLAAILHAGGHHQEAEAASQEARALFAEKGNQAGAARLRPPRAERPRA